MVTNIIILLISVWLIFKTNKNSVLNDPEMFLQLIQARIANTISDNTNKLLNEIKVYEHEMQQKFQHFQVELLRELNNHREALLLKFNQLNNEIKECLNADVAKLVESVRAELDKMNSKVEEKLKDGFNKTNETFANILIRLTKIDEAQKKIDELSTEIVSLQDVLTDKKSRGIFGEIQLNQILNSVFGENNHKIYSIQHKLSNANIVDAMLFLPEPLGQIAIDSKFPLENYKRMIDKNLAAEARKLAEKEFENNVKKHIDDIATKYIIPNETATHAIMFIPAEAIFAQIHAYHDNLIIYAQKNNIWLTSPSTLMALLTTIQVVVKNIEQTKHAKIIQENLRLLSDDFKRYKDRWDKLSAHIRTINKDVDDINITTEKIGNRFDKIAKVELIEEN